MECRGDVRARVGRVQADGPGPETVWDRLAVEDPLEIQVAHGPEDSRQNRVVAVTMRTPGHDDELAIGFLLSERIVRNATNVESVAMDPPRTGRRLGDVVRVVLRPGVELDPRRLERNFAATSSCGVCGKANLRALGLDGCGDLTAVGPKVDLAALHDLPARLRKSQSLFESTGGLHAAGLFAGDGALLAVREDVGRHNTVDKLIGARAHGRLDRAVDSREPMGLLVSGRIGFEIVQKALVGGIALIIAVGAPTSLAVETAEAFGQTLIGFFSPQRFNVYCGSWRVRFPASAEVPDPGRHAV